MLFEQFVAARERAITLTDHFWTIDVDDPGRRKLWEHVMRQTDTAKLLLERWLRSGKLTDQAHPGSFDFRRGTAPCDSEIF